MMVPIQKNISSRVNITKKEKRSVLLRGILILAGLSVLFLLSAVLINKTRNPVNDERQAVFMTNGQIFFGYVGNKDSKMIEIKDAYYLNSIDSLYPKDKEEKISLIKMGSELHKPKGNFLVNRDQVISIQTMNNDSQINKAISNSINK